LIEPREVALAQLAERSAHQAGGNRSQGTFRERGMEQTGFPPELDREFSGTHRITDGGHSKDD